MKTSLTFNGLLLSVWMVARRLLEHYQHSENNSLRNRIDIKEILKSASDRFDGVFTFSPLLPFETW